ncbi:MAG: hypothetical protein JNM70_06230 [Anaerolineae bacterium]|nr:hypothetical protein [Anaerolineae bacterium]
MTPLLAKRGGAGGGDVICIAPYPAAPLQPIVCKYRIPLQLQDSRNCNCTGCNNCNNFSLHVRTLPQFALPQLPKLPQQKRPRRPDREPVIDQPSVSAVPSVDMAFRQPDHLSVWRRNCNNSRDLHVQLLRYLQHFWHSAAYMQGFWHTIAILPLPKLPPFVPICPSGMSDISDDSSSLAIR